MPSTPRRRVIEVGAYGLANALPRVIAALLALVYTAEFSLAEYGAYGILSVLVLLLSAVIDLGNTHAVMRNYYSYQHDWTIARRFLADAILSADVVALATLPILGAALYLSWEAFGIHFVNHSPYIPIVLALAFCERTSIFLSFVLRATEQPVNYLLGPIADAAVSLIAGIAFVLVFHWGVMGAMAAALMGRATSVLVYKYIFRAFLNIQGGSLNWPLIRKGMAFGLPLTPTRISLWLREAGLRPLLTYVTSMANVGIFSFASSIASLPGLLSLAVDLALSPYYLKQRTIGIDGFTARIKDFSTLFLATLAPIWAALILFSQELIDGLIGERYAAAAPVCSILLCASFLRMQQAFFIRQIHYIRRTWIQFTVVVPVAACSVALTLLFASRFGIEGAAYGVLVAEIFCCIGFALLIRLFEPLHYPLVVAASLSAILILLAFGAHALAALPGSTIGFFVAKLAIFVAITLVCVYLFIWPKRNFVMNILRN